MAGRGIAARFMAVGCAALALLALGSSPGLTGCGLNDCVELFISTESLPGGVVGTEYQLELVADSECDSLSDSDRRFYIRWSVVSGDLPPGVGINSSGEIHGTPTLAGSYVFTISVTHTNREANAEKGFSLVIKEAG